MDDFLIKLPTIRTQSDGYVNTAKGDFGFPLELVECFDQNAAASTESHDNNETTETTESMEME